MPIPIWHGRPGLAGLSGSDAVSATYLEYVGSGVRQVKFHAAARPWIVPFVPPQGALLTGVMANVRHGNAGASGQMSMRVYRYARNNLTGVVVQLGSTLTFAAGTGHHIEEVVISADNQVDNKLFEYLVAVHPSSLTTTITDELHWLTATLA
jgi:hypothetical protein